MAPLCPPNWKQLELVLLGSLLVVILCAALWAEVSVWTRTKHIQLMTSCSSLGQTSPRQLWQSCQWEGCGAELQLLCYCSCCFHNHLTTLLSPMADCTRREDEASFLHWRGWDGQSWFSSDGARLGWAALHWLQVQLHQWHLDKLPCLI